MYLSLVFSSLLLPCLLFSRVGVSLHGLLQMQNLIEKWAAQNTHTGEGWIAAVVCVPWGGGGSNQSINVTYLHEWINQSIKQTTKNPPSKTVFSYLNQEYQWNTRYTQDTFIRNVCRANTLCRIKFHPHLQSYWSLQPTCRIVFT